MNRKKENTISAEEFDRIFDEGEEDVLQYFDLSAARRLNTEVKRINVDMPVWMLNALDLEAERLNISRQAVLKTKLDEVLSD
jgi:hypothetical protein